MRCSHWVFKSELPFAGSIGAIMKAIQEIVQYPVEDSSDDVDDTGSIEIW